MHTEDAERTFRESAGRESRVELCRSQLGRQERVVNNAELLVKRGSQFIGKVRVTSVEPSTSIADIVGEQRSTRHDDFTRGQRHLPIGRPVALMRLISPLLWASPPWLVGCAQDEERRAAQEAGGTPSWNRPHRGKVQGMPGITFKDHSSALPRPCRAAFW